MYENLKAGLAARGMGVADIQRVISRTHRSAKDKLEGRAMFTLSEAINIRDALFPGESLDFLFVQPYMARPEHRDSA